MNENFELAIVIPVYNSAETLKELTRQIMLALQSVDLNYQLVFVNDGSRDNSWNELVKLQESIPNVTIVNLEENFGQHSALLCGFHFTRSRYVVTLDDDLQYSPDSILQLYEAITQDNAIDAVIGIPENRSSPYIKKVGSYLVNFFLMKKNGHPKTLRAGSFRIMKDKIIKNLKQYQLCNPYLGLMLLESCDKIVNITVNHYPRQYGKSGYHTIKIIKHFCHLLTFRVQSPIAILKRVGLYSLFLFVMLIAFADLARMELIKASLLQHCMQGLIMAILVLVVFTTFFIIKTYIGKYLHIIRQNPIFTIKEKIGSAL